MAAPRTPKSAAPVRKYRRPPISGRALVFLFERRKNRRITVAIRLYRGWHYPRSFCAKAQTERDAMRYSLIAATTALAAAGMMALASATGMRRRKLVFQTASPPRWGRVKPYQAVAVTLPKEFNDPGFVAFRKQLGEIAEHKDKAALGKIVVAQGFFWMQDKDVADKKKSGLENLVHWL